MKQYKADDLRSLGYTLENVRITNVELTMADYGVLTMKLTLEGYGMGCVYGGYVLGKGYVGSQEFEGYAKGTEAIMRIMDVIGESEFTKLKGKYARIAYKSWESGVKIIGNIIKDKWFDYGTFFDEEVSE